MPEKKSNNFRIPFDDRDLPLDDLSVERTEEIERLVMPRMEKAFEELLKKKPGLDRRNT